MKIESRLNYDPRGNGEKQLNFFFNAKETKFFEEKHI